MLKINRLNLIKSTQSSRHFFWGSKATTENKNVQDKSVVDEPVEKPIKTKPNRTENLIRIVNIDQTELLNSESFLDNYRSTPDYQSKYSLKKVYPDSSLDFTKDVPVSFLNSFFNLSSLFKFFFLSFFKCSHQKMKKNLPVTYQWNNLNSHLIVALDQVVKM